MNSRNQIRNLDGTGVILSLLHETLSFAVKRKSNLKKNGYSIIVKHKQPTTGKLFSNDRQTLLSVDDQEGLVKLLRLRNTFYTTKLSTKTVT